VKVDDDPPVSWTAAVSVCVDTLLFAGMVKVTAPLPVPLVGDAPNPLALHVQALFVVVTFTVAKPPA
jgi:hypothetical protein